jgi:methylmalonyl-CoA mutase cobalamin-binding subunit
VGVSDPKALLTDFFFLKVTQLLRASGFLGVIVICSGNCMESDAARYREAGADGTWPKPYPTALQMLDDIKNMTSERQSQRNGKHICDEV